MNAIHAQYNPWSSIDLRQIRAFATVANARSFTKAGQQLNLTQSAVSHSVRAFEEQIGAPLFVRDPRSLRLTREGEALLQRCQRILSELELAHRDLSRFRRWDQASVKAGIATSLCALALPSVLREFRESFPSVDIRIVPGDSPDLLRALDTREIDLAITVHPSSPGIIPSGIRSSEVFRDEIGLVFSPLHPLANKSDLQLSDLVDQRFIVYGGRSLTRDMTRQWLEREVSPSDTPLELHSVEAMRELAMINFGMALLPAWSARRALSDGFLCYRPLPGRASIQRIWSAFFRESSALDLPESVFLGISRSVCKTL